jgi:hypothetical protein
MLGLSVFALRSVTRYLGVMVADDRVACPACFIALPPLAPGARESECTSCGYVWAPPEDLQQTVEHTPMAKRRSSRPGE